MATSFPHDFEIPVPAGVNLLPYQDEGVRYALERKVTLIADQPGLGKSAQAIAFCNSFGVRRVLVICPATLKVNWSREWAKFSVHDHLSVGVASAKTGFPDTDVVVINFDIVDRFQELIASIKWDVLVVDEAHFIKGEDSGRTQCILGRKASPGNKNKGIKPKRALKPIPYKRLLLLTGTPVLNVPTDLWVFLRLADPEGMGADYVKFLTRYHKLAPTPFGKKLNLNGKWQTYSIVGTQNLDELNRLLKERFMIRRHKDDVLKDLPPKRQSVIELPADGVGFKTLIERERKAYEAARNKVDLASEDFETQVERLKTEQASDKVTALEDLASSRQEVALKKLPMACEFIDNLIAQGQKVVVFGYHIAVMDALRERYPGAACITGKVPEHKRQGEVDRFMTDPNCTVFLGQIKAAGVGLTLTVASTVVFVEIDYVPANLEQAEDRCIAAGQPVLTPQGWVPIEEISVGDEVITHTGNIKRVTDAWKRGSTKTMCELTIEGWPQNIVCTHDHQFLMPDGSWKEAGILRPGDRVSMPNIEVHPPSLISIPFPDECRSSNTFVNHGHVQTNARLLKAPDEIELTTDALFSFGYFVGDGFASTASDKGRFLSFSGHRTKKRASLDVCERWARSVGMNVSCYESKINHCTELRAYSTEWAVWFQAQFGKGAHGKHLPKWMLTLNKEQSSHVLRGLVASDGYVRKGRVEYITVSKQLAANVALLMRRAGFRPCLTFMSHCGAHVVSYSVSQSESSALVRSNLLRYPKKIDGKREPVYDLTVEDDQSYVVGMSAVHNCHRISQLASVIAYYLVLEGSVDASIVRKLVDKQAIINQAIN